jgi:copper homeostasis protein
MRRLEICVDDAVGLAAAVAGGADRIELCSALALGGLTPSVGLMRLSARCGVPVMAMIRPRAGGFDWSGADLEVQEAEIAAARDAGLAGVVIGATAGDGLDLPALRRLVAAAGPLAVTLHRAVDLVGDPLLAVRQAADLGISRILSSGGARTAPEGLDRLAAMMAVAGPVTIMPGGGLTPETLPAVLARLNPSEVHASGSIAAAPPAAELLRFGFAAEAARRTDRQTVARLKALVSD